MNRLSGPTHRASFSPSSAVKRRLTAQERLASHLLGQVADAFLAADNTQFDNATDAYDATKAKISKLERELPIVEGTEDFLDRLAKTQPELGKVTVASVAFGQDLQFLRVGQVDLTERH